MFIYVKLWTFQLPSVPVHLGTRALARTTFSRIIAAPRPIYLRTHPPLAHQGQSGYIRVIRVIRVCGSTSTNPKITQKAFILLLAGLRASDKHATHSEVRVPWTYQGLGYSTNSRAMLGSPTYTISIQPTAGYQVRTLCIQHGHTICNMYIYSYSPIIHTFICFLFELQEGGAPPGSYYSLHAWDLFKGTQSTQLIIIHTHFTLFHLSH